MVYTQVHHIVYIDDSSSSCKPVCFPGNVDTTRQDLVILAGYHVIVFINSILALKQLLNSCSIFEDLVCKTPLLLGFYKVINLVFLVYIFYINVYIHV